MSEPPKIEEGQKIIADLMSWLSIPETPGTKDTAFRVARMYSEVFRSLYSAPPAITTFPAEDGYVAVTDIYFNSFCEHHLLPFSGKCGVVYHSKGRVVGLSKIPRIVDYWCARPQIQENLTMQIARDIMKRLKPYGVYIAMSARHSCMEIRGIKARGSITNTAAVLGSIDKEEAIKLLTANNFFDR